MEIMRGGSSSRANVFEVFGGGEQYQRIAKIRKRENLPPLASIHLLRSTTTTYLKITYYVPNTGRSSGKGQISK